MSRVLDFIASQAWGIQEPALQTILEIAAREAPDVEAIEREMGRPLKNTREVRVRDGVAVVPVSGPLFRYANLFTRISGATSYEELATDIGTALESPDVQGIALDVDSPGGLVNGNQELAELIFRARTEKPVVAFISGTGASAAYWLASSATRVVVSPTALVGSIGTVLSMEDRSAQDEARGIERLEFVSAQSPKKRLDPFADDPEEREEARSEVQEMVDNIAQVFVETVARNRDVSVETVLSDFGQGGILVGEDAVEAGMADAVGTLEDVIADMSRRARGAAGPRATAAGTSSAPKTPSMEADMSDTAQKPAAEQQPVIDRAYLEANHAELLSELQAEAATAERERVLAIQALDGPEDIVAECVEDPSVTAGDAALKVLAAKKEQDRARAKAHLKVRAETEEGLDAPAPSAGTDSEATEEAVRAKRAVALHNQLKGRDTVASA